MLSFSLRKLIGVQNSCKEDTVKKVGFICCLYYFLVFIISFKKGKLRKQIVNIVCKVLCLQAAYDDYEEFCGNLNRFRDKIGAHNSAKVYAKMSNTLSNPLREKVVLLTELET